MMRLVKALLLSSLLMSCGSEQETKEPVNNWEDRLSFLVVNKLSVDNNKVVLAE